MGSRSRNTFIDSFFISRMFKPGVSQYKWVVFYSECSVQTNFHWISISFDFCLFFDFVNFLSVSNLIFRFFLSIFRDAILKSYKCIEVQCTFQTDISKELSKHIRTSHSKEKRKYECDTCDFATFSYLALIHHFESCESEEKDNSCSKIQTTKCQLCDFSHATDAGIIDHILKSHVPQKPKNAKIITKIPLIKLKRI